MNKSELLYFLGIYCVPGPCETLYACHLFMFYCPSPHSPSTQWLPGWSPSGLFHPHYHPFSAQQPELMFKHGNQITSLRVLST